MKTTHFPLKAIKNIFISIISMFFIVAFFTSCGSTSSTTGSISKEDISLLKKPTNIYVYYFNNNSGKEDGSYQYQPEGREIIKNLFKQKGYEVIFTRYRNYADFYIQLIQSDGSSEYSYKSEETVGTYRDNSGNTIGTYNTPTTKYFSKNWTRIDLYVYDPKTTYGGKNIYHFGTNKSGGNYNTRLRSLLKTVINKLPSRK